ncbi:hypothetical protein BDV96DRAFT_274508 [Lophiotrema nucula]|uniref:Uncharacterized protein n=1 Tax=Lophiotrema nucula TaxID=690887 RepID=A0A6A5ZMB9_9PLEO|nr:hypothetical protein BDV96DRAFT_274508 [Lophiotrema nucula]
MLGQHCCKTRGDDKKPLQREHAARHRSGALWARSRASYQASLCPLPSRGFPYRDRCYCHGPPRRLSTTTVLTLSLCSQLSSPAVEADQRRDSSSRLCLFTPRRCVPSGQLCYRSRPTLHRPTHRAEGCEPARTTLLAVAGVAATELRLTPGSR